MLKIQRLPELKHWVVNEKMTSFQRIIERCLLLHLENMLDQHSEVEG